MLGRLGRKNLNTALKVQTMKARDWPRFLRPTLGMEFISGSSLTGMHVELKGMHVKLRKLLKRRDTTQPRAKSPGFGGDKYVSPVRAKQDWQSYEDSECDIFLA